MKARVENGRVLVHCRAGVSRSTSLVAACMMHAAHASDDTVIDEDITISDGGTDRLRVSTGTANIPRSLAEVIKHVIIERPIICPNSSFRKQLITYEFELFHRNSLSCDTEFLDLIHVESKLYSGDHATETDYDRMPIQALKTLKPEASWTWENAFPTSEAPDVNNPAVVSVVGMADASQPAVSKKSFLKRNPKRVVKQTKTGSGVSASSSASTRDVPQRIPLKERLRATAAVTPKVEVVDSNSKSNSI